MTALALVQARALDLVQLAKPRLTSMVIFTTLGGFLLAPGRVDVVHAILTVIGTTLVVAAANTLNMYWERDSDAFMERTRDRPLPAGRMQPAVALWFGVGLTAISLPLLASTAGPLPATLAAVAFLSYVFVYTPLKRRSWLAVLVGAVPGAMPPLIGWSAQTQHLDAAGLALFAILFVWQLPHFVAISIYRLDEYVRAGIRVLPAVHGVAAAKVHLLVYALLLLPVTLALEPLGVTGRRYTVVAAVLGAGFVGGGFAGLSARRGPRWARGMFLYSLVYLTVIFAVLAADARLR